MCPRLFTIGTFSVPTYGVLVALGFVIGLYLVGRLAPRSGLNTDDMTNLAVYVGLAAILGAKAFMVLSNLGYYLDNPGQFFSLSTLQAGGVFYGGLLAALAVAAWYANKANLPALAAADVLAPSVAVGHSIGRLGCFAAGCCWGQPTSLPWGVMFTDPTAHDSVGVPLGIHLHPTQLYEAAGTFAVAIVLLKLFRKPHAPGTILGWYFVLYSSFRFAIEFLRDHSPQSFPFDGPLSSTQWVALLLIAAGAYLLTRQKGSPAAQPAS